MGHVIHQQLIVVSAFEDELESAHKRAEQLFGEGVVSPVLQAATNGFRSFFVGTSGSKDGWGAATNHDNRMWELVRFIEDINVRREGRFIRFHEVRVSEDDEFVPHIRRGN